MPSIPLLLSAGEASGDMYAARLATALKSRADVEIFGMGGPQMRAAGVEIIVDYSEVALVGITEIVRHLPALLRAMKRLVSAAQRRKPALAILTDFPGFHLRLAKKLRAQGIPNIYYVCPQFWAWRPWRVRIVRRNFTRGLCIFPFEEKFYADAGVPVMFIGHPLVDAVHASIDRKTFCRKHALDPGKPLVAVLPGSRESELRQHLPVLQQACLQIHNQMHSLDSNDVGHVQFVVAAAPNSHSAEMVRSQSTTSGWPQNIALRIVENETYDALGAADAAIVSSGTATVETALLDVPMVVVYRLSPLTAMLAKPLIRTPFVSMVNLIAGKRVVPELIQENFTPQNISREIVRLLRDPSARQAQRSELAQVRANLGSPGAVERAADTILEALKLVS